MAWLNLKLKHPTKKSETRRWLRDAERAIEVEVDKAVSPGDLVSLRDLLILFGFAEITLRGKDSNASG